MLKLPAPTFTVEEYFTLVAMSQEKREYSHGHIYAMSGGSYHHSKISGNAFALLLRTDCEASNSDLLVKATEADYFYPDASLVCGEPILVKKQGVDALTNPTLIVEVLSPSTKDFDVSDKFDAYQQIPSFREYLLIFQDKARVQQHFKDDNGWWTRIDIIGLGSQVHLRSVNGTLNMKDLYKYVVFETE